MAGPPERVRRRLSEDERRAQIIAATIAAVADHGYEGASLARIAERADVSKGLISHYFGDKDSLMEQAVTTTVATLRDSVAAQLDLTAPVPEVIRAAIRRAADLNVTHRDELRALTQIIHNLRGPDGGRRLSLTDYEQTYQAQETLFRRGQAEGTLRAFDTRVMAVTYQGAIDMMLSYADAYPDTDMQHYADTLATILLTGIEA